MSVRNLVHATGSMGNSSYVQGDYDPADFKYTNPIERSELLSLLIRNSKIQKGTLWFASEMLRERWEFEVEQPISAPKHDETKVLFKTYNEWLEWIGFMQELLKVLTWSLLFGDAILVFYTGKEVSAKEVKLQKAESYVKCKAYYPLTSGNGYTIEKVNALFNIPEKYKIILAAEKANESVTIHAPKECVVLFHAPAKELTHTGTSNVSAIAHDCIAQEHLKRGVVTVAQNLLPGILACKAADVGEMEIINSSIGDTLTHLRRLFFKNIDEIEGLIKIIIPDMKITQIEGFNKILQTDIGTGIDMSISLLEGAAQGVKASAAFDTFNTYSKVKQLQSHYKHAMEEAFYKLGKIDTTFTWNDPSPQMPSLEDNPQNKEDPDKPDINEDSKEGSDENKNEEVKES